MNKIFIRSPYNYDRDTASEETGLACQDATLTKQSFAEECDINTIVKRFGITGELPQNVRMPTYMDYEGIFDFHSAMNAIAKAHESFGAMPAEIRARFNNDPGQFVDFCSDANNLEEAKKLGLVEPKGLTTGNPAQQEKTAPAAEKPAAASPPAGGDKNVTQ